MKLYKSYKLKNVIKFFIFLIFFLILLLFSKENFDSVKNSVYIFISSIIPSLFPFIFFTEFILNTDILKIIQYYTGRFFSKIFKISENSSPAIITGFLCGFPMGAKTVANLYKTNSISKNEANKLLSFINNCNPAFLLSTIGIGIFGNIKIGILLAISHYLSAILIGIFFFRKSTTDIIHKKKTNLNSFDKNIKDKNTFNIIKNCIKNTFITLSMILGFMILFNLLFTIINKILCIFSIDKNISYFLSGLFEVTSGANNIKNSIFPIEIKLVLTSFILGFSGLCIICQIYSTISNYKFSFSKLIKYKFIHGIISCIITYILLKYTNIYNLDAISVFNSIDDNKKDFYILQMKHAYLISTFIIIIILFIYYLIRKKVVYKNIDYKKEGG